MQVYANDVMNFPGRDQGLAQLPGEPERAGPVTRKKLLSFLTLQMTATSAQLLKVNQTRDSVKFPFRAQATSKVYVQTCGVQPADQKTVWKIRPQGGAEVEAVKTGVRGSG